MSAWIVEDETVNAIVSTAQQFLLVPGSLWVRDAAKTGPALMDAYLKLDEHVDDEEGRAMLARNLMALNYESVGRRYAHLNGEKPGETHPLDEFAYKVIPPRPLLAAIKTMACWSYQSCEYGCDAMPLFLFIEKLRETVAEAYVRSQPVFADRVKKVEASAMLPLPGRDMTYTGLAETVTWYRDSLEYWR